MAEFSRFGITETLTSGIDFYTGDEQVPQVTVSAEGNLVITITKFAISASSIDINSNATTNITKFAYASANINEILSVVATVATERHDAIVTVSSEVSTAINITKISIANVNTSIESNTSVNVTKIALGAANTSSETTVVSAITKTAYAVSNTSVESTVSTTAKKIALAAASLTAETTVSVAGKISLATIRINVLNNTVINTQIIRYAANTSIGQDTSLIRTLLLLDGKPLTNHNRSLSMELQPIFTENKIWNNRKNRYYRSSSRGTRRQFSLSWSFVPNDSADTVDGKDGRDFFAQVAEDPDYHTLTVINMDATGATPDTETTYNVLVKDYSERLIRRDLGNDIYLWDCSMTLEEV